MSKAVWFLIAIAGLALVGSAAVAQTSEPSSEPQPPAADPSEMDSLEISGFIQQRIILAPYQIASVAENAGFSGDELTTAVAIALAESGGNPIAYNPETAAGTPQGKGSYGLWQIYLKAHPEYEGADLTDPQTNANAAFAIYRAAGSFSPWSTYKSQAYTRFLNAAVNA